MDIVKVTLIRHGESEWNKLNLFCGWYDADLSEEGANDACQISAPALIKNNLIFDKAYTSGLKRAQHSLRLILEEIKQNDLPIQYDWRLNERHYGDLTGYNKRQLANKFGERQVQIWRRSYDICPPTISAENPYYYAIRNNPKFHDIPHHLIPDTESLKMVMDRVVPVWENEIKTDIACGKNVLIVAHGTVVRALMKHIEDISSENIQTLNVPNSIPCVYQFDANTLQRLGPVTFLAEENYLNKQMEKTASIGN